MVCEICKFWGQGHACNTLISGATVQRSISLGCSCHFWHTINMQSFPGFAEENFCPFDTVLAFIFCPTKLLTQIFGKPLPQGSFHLSSVVILLFPPLLHTLLSPCIALLVTKQAAIHRPPFSAPGLLSCSLSHPAFPSPDGQSDPKAATILQGRHVTWGNLPCPVIGMCPTALGWVCLHSRLSLRNHR